ncbi:Glyoxalase superfamily enzyme, possibly 3-demethylubiquinone-9 3-methyltransferase [Streptomyces sp. DvalAA-14]|uniref:VOC family protein n=1 Tax=unclassified Streptomyces TaxID=2593676 RepID=UPI00081AEBC9|nr:MULTISPECIES: VOC family protein [unclassified Streptomyces]MYS24637.1 VOC family protein [Streptomyces sp. SID4948]SCE47972.1 Glyoxalase superfamily enzyme, possibly 3-demethylubiquinone-9 3-methyltransferase [Streptomyces sp. DvalAA-14]
MTANGFTTALWFDGQAEEAAEFYVSVFKNAEIGRIARYTEAGPGEPGAVVTVEFTANGQRFVGINGGPQFTFDEAISFQIHCDDQAEIDYYWGALTANGGHEVQCGWLRDRFGLSWQVIPSELTDLISSPDAEGATRASRAMLSMKKLDIAELKRAFAAA